MKYLGIALGVLLTIIGLVAFPIIAASLVPESVMYSDPTAQSFGVQFLARTLDSFACLLGGFVAGLFTRGTRSRGWVIGVGAIVGFTAGALLTLLGGIGGSTPVASAFVWRSLIGFTLWPAAGALGGLLAWLPPGSAKR